MKVIFEYEVDLPRDHATKAFVDLLEAFMADQDEDGYEYRGEDELRSDIAQWMVYKYHGGDYTTFVALENVETAERPLDPEDDPHGSGLIRPWDHP